MRIAVLSIICFLCISHTMASEYEVSFKNKEYNIPSDCSKFSKDAFGYIDMISGVEFRGLLAVKNRCDAERLANKPHGDIKEDVVSNYDFKRLEMQKLSYAHKCQLIGVAEKSIHEACQQEAKEKLNYFGYPVDSNLNYDDSCRMNGGKFIVGTTFVENRTVYCDYNHIDKTDREFLTLTDVKFNDVDGDNSMDAILIIAKSGYYSHVHWVNLILR